MIREVFFTFLTGTAVFLLILLLFQAVRLMEFMVVHQVKMVDVARLCYYLGLTFLPLALPIAFLFAVLMGISRANSEGEIVGFQASGVSLRQLFAPIGTFSVLLSFAVLYLSLYTVPWGNRSFEMLYTKVGNDRIISALKPGVFTHGFFGLTLLADHIIPIKNELQRVFIYDAREKEHPVSITAEAGILKHPVGNKGLITLRLSNGAIHIEAPEAVGVQQKIDFDVYDINLELGERGEVWRDYSPPSYNVTQLREKIREAEHNPGTQRELRVELHRRYSMSFACLVFAALGFVIGLLSQRGLRSSSIVLCLVVGLLYWMSYIGANALAIAGIVPPWLGIWVPNFAFLGLAYYGYHRYRFG
ncbi:LptF/LptG family permease [bacterium]|nr:LptF/LptG family permease [bacterium]